MDHIDKATRGNIAENLYECKSKLIESLKEIDCRREAFEKLEEQWKLNKNTLQLTRNHFFAIRDIKELLRDLDTKVQYLIDTYLDTNIEFIPNDSFREANRPYNQTSVK